MANCGTIEVVSQDTFDPSAVSSTGCTVVSGSSISPGGSSSAAGTITNNNSSDAKATVELVVNGAQEQTQPVTVPANSNVEATFDVTFQEQGTYDLEVNVASATKA